MPRGTLRGTPGARTVFVGVGTERLTSIIRAAGITDQ